MLIKHREPYGPLRSKSYPDIGDQLDALYKMALALKAQGIQLPKETLEWIDRCTEVKNTFKKN